MTFIWMFQLTAGTAKRPLFSKEIVSSIFTPALNSKGQATLSTTLKSLDPFSPWEEGGAQWSTACAVNVMDWPGRRKKCSGNCKLYNLFFFVFFASSLPSTQNFFLQKRVWMGEHGSLHWPDNWCCGCFWYAGVAYNGYLFFWLSCEVRECAL